MSNKYLSKENLIFKTPAPNSNFHIREQQGKFQRIRRSLNCLLVPIFILIPFIRYQDTQAVYFDLLQQKLHLFSVTLFPQDLFIVSLIFILAAYALFYITKLYGRIWCGFVCPQTIWVLLFNWVERRIEGSPNQSQLLDSQAFGLTKACKKSLKHFIWFAISLFTSLVFISYFYPAERLYSDFFTFQVSSLVQFWVWFFAACTYINAAWVREKMCQHICPYSRFQSAMFDKSTKLVSYDHQRGENRGKRKRLLLKPKELGDCVDCKLCVQVCPVGIDIRDGLQYECINCGLCIDACNTIMQKFKYAKGLITFASEVSPSSPWKRHISYGLIILVTVLTMFVWAQTKQNFEVNIVRDRQSLYRVNHSGHIENSYMLKVLNKSNQPKVYSVWVEGPSTSQIHGDTKFTLLPGEISSSYLAISINQPMQSLKSSISF